MCAAPVLACFSSHAIMVFLIQHPKTVCWPTFASLGVSAVGVTVAVALMVVVSCSRIDQRAQSARCMHSSPLS